MARYRQVTRLTRGVNGRVKRTAQLVLERRPVVGDTSKARKARALRYDACVCGGGNGIGHFSWCEAVRPAQTFAGRLALAESMLADPDPQVMRAAVAVLSTGMRANVCVCGEGHVGTCRRCFGSAPPSARPPDELPPGWIRNERLCNVIEHEVDPFDYVVVRIGGLSRGYHDGTEVTNPEGVLMHEAMRLARGLATVEELWSAP